LISALTTMKRLSKKHDDGGGVEPRNHVPSSSKPSESLNAETEKHARSTTLIVVQASLAYFFISVGVTAVLDTFRRIILEIWYSKLVALLAETPFLLGLFWSVSLWSTRRFVVSPKPQTRLVMSLIAFLLFLCVEACMAIAVMGISREEFFEYYVTSFYTEFPANLIGRLLEFVYALVPFYQGLLEERSRSKRNEE